MTCKWCHEFSPTNRKDGFCSDICEDHWKRAMAQPDKAAPADKFAMGVVGLHVECDIPSIMIAVSVPEGKK